MLLRRNRYPKPIDGILVCSVCLIPKYTSEFNKNSKMFNGYHSWCKDCEKKRNKKRIRGTKEWRVANIKSCARTRHIAVNMSNHEIMSFWQKPCSYCGSNIETIGLDRVDYKKPYSMDNVVSCCRICNVMKFTLGVEAFIAHCQKVVDHTRKNRLPEVA